MSNFKSAAVVAGRLSQQLSQHRISNVLQQKVGRHRIFGSDPTRAVTIEEHLALSMHQNRSEDPRDY